jgi:hypothetical protein
MATYNLKVRLNASCDVQVSLNFGNSSATQNDFQRLANSGGYSGELNQFRNVLQTINRGDVITVSGRFVPPSMGFNGKITNVTQIQKGN